MRQNRICILYALGFLSVVLALVSSAQVSFADEGFMFPYKTYKVTQTCHPDGWGTYVGVPSTCAVDIRAGCGAEGVSPVSGQLYSFTDDGMKVGNTAAIIKGSRYWVFIGCSRTCSVILTPSWYLQEF